MVAERWPTATELTHLAFDVGNRRDFRREVMGRLMRCTGSDMAIFADATTPIESSHVIHMDPHEAEAARRTVLSHPRELSRANQRLRERGVMVDTNIYTQRQWERLPHIERHQVAMGITSNLVMSWQPPRGVPVVANLCLARGRYSEDHERTAYAMVKALAVADAWFGHDRADRGEPVPDLTERQREILFYVRRGFTNPEIARACHLSPFTVRNHLVGLFERYQVSTRTELAVASSRDDEE